MKGRYRSAEVSDKDFETFMKDYRYRGSKRRALIKARDFISREHPIWRFMAKGLLGYAAGGQRAYVQKKLGDIFGIPAAHITLGGIFTNAPQTYASVRLLKPSVEDFLIQFGDSNESPFIDWLGEHGDLFWVGLGVYYARRFYKALWRNEPSVGVGPKAWFGMAGIEAGRFVFNPREYVRGAYRDSRNYVLDHPLLERILSKTGINLQDEDPMIKGDNVVDFEYIASRFGGSNNEEQASED